MSSCKNTHRRILVTGAAGFVGGRVVEAMALSGYATPVANVRRWTRAARMARFPIEIRPFDLLDPAATAAAVRDVDAIVHCASADERTAIVEGTRNLLQAAVSERVSRFVYISTAEVYGTNAAGSINESSAVQITGSAYADSKIEAETLCRQFHPLGIKPTILRPSLIYGPFGQSWTIDIAQRLMSGRWNRFEGLGDGIANLIYVDDLVQAIFLAITHERAPGGVYNVNGPDRVTWNEYFDRFNKALGRPPLASLSADQSRWKTASMEVVSRSVQFARRYFEEPLMAMYLRGGRISRLMKIVKRMVDTTPTANELHGLYARHAIYEDRKIRECLGYAPTFSLDEGLRLSAQFLQQYGLIPAHARDPMNSSPRNAPSHSSAPASRPRQERNVVHAQH